MIGFIISCLLTFELICIREFAASRASGRSETITSETNYSIPNSNLAERTSISDLVGPTEKAFKSQDATLTDRNQSSRSPYNQSPQTSSGDQDRKSPRLYLSRAIIATMSQHSQVKNNKRLNVTNSTHNYVDVEKVTFKDEKPQKRVGTNPVKLLNDKPVSFQGNTTEQNNTEICNTSQYNNTKDSANNTPINVSLEDRSSFVGDGCASGYAKVNGKCVPIKQ